MEASLVDALVPQQEIPGDPGRLLIPADDRLAYEPKLGGHDAADVRCQWRHAAGVRGTRDIGDVQHEVTTRPEERRGLR